MIIEEKDFKLTPISDSSTKFDLDLLYKIQPKGKEARWDFKNAGYGISLEYAIKKIAHYRVYNKHRDEAIKIKTYFTDYISELNSLKKLLS